MKDFEQIKENYPEDYLVYSFIPVDYINSVFYVNRELFRELCVTSFLQPQQGKDCRYAAIVRGYICHEDGVSFILEDPYRTVHTQAMKKVSEEDAYALQDKVVLLHGCFEGNLLNISGYLVTKLDSQPLTAASKGIPEEFAITFSAREQYGFEDCNLALNSLFDFYAKKKRDWGIVRTQDDFMILYTYYSQFDLFIYQGRLYLIRDKYQDLPRFWPMHRAATRPSMSFNPMISVEYFSSMPHDLRRATDKRQTELMYTGF